MQFSANAYDRSSWADPIGLVPQIGERLLLNNVGVERRDRYT